MSALDRLEVGQRGLRGDLARLQTGQDELRTDLTRLRVDLMARLDRHEAHFAALRDDIAVGLGAARSIKRAGDSTREELHDLGETVSALWRQIKRLEERLIAIDGGR